VITQAIKGDHIRHQ